MQEVEDERENISGNQSVIDSLAPGGFCQSAVRSGVHTCCLARVALQLKKPAAAHHGATGLKLYVDLLQAPVMQRAHISQAVGGGAPHQAASATTGSFKMPFSCCVPPVASTIRPHRSIPHPTRSN